VTDISLAPAEPTTNRVTDAIDAPGYRHGLDPLEPLLVQAMADGGGTRDPEAVRRASSALLAGARRDGAYHASLAAALALVAQAPSIEPPQRTVAYLLDGMGDSAAALACWRGILARFPLSTEAFGYTIRLTARQYGADVATAVFADRFADPDALAEPSLLRMASIGLEEIKRPHEAATLLDRVVRRVPEDAASWLRLARLREDLAGPQLAAVVLTDAVAASPVVARDPRIAGERKRLDRVIARLLALVPEARDRNEPPWRVVLDHMLGQARERRAGLVGRIPSPHGGIVLVGGSLGGGGAERQLVTTATGLAEAIALQRPVGGSLLDGPVTVVCRRLGARHRHDFFLPVLQAAGVPAIDYMALPPMGGAAALSAVKPHAGLLEFLPVRMREGVRHLTDQLRLLSPEVVQVWQDGMVAAAGLAALLADVPRIVLNVRTLPPTDRADRWSAEQEPLYRGLLSMPGVVLTANSAIAATRYEQWLGLPARSIAVIPNGVPRLPEGGAADEHARFEAFDLQTGGGFTLGGVMRFDHNKRPLGWLAVAERLLADRPDARFILIGDGELRRTAEELAELRGFSDRVLFVGRSSHVGYWLARFDALLLTSRHEGLPNVLIEAQRAGVPVITTPAGGAAETLVPGVTGHVLASAEKIDVEEAVALIARIADIPADRREATRATARDWAAARFAIPAMLDRTAEVLMSPIDAPLIGG